MAEAVAEGARKAGAAVDIKRVPETAPEAVVKAAHFKLDQQALVAAIADLASYDTIIIDAPTRFGRMPSHMAAFLDQAGGGIVTLPKGSDFLADFNSATGVLSIEM
jgi:NAD(P)H dehydrogenase (quinone)